MRRLVRGALALVCAGIGCGAALAHTGGTSGYAAISISGNAIRYSLTLSSVPMPSALAEQMGFGQAGVTPTYQPLVDAIASSIHLRNGDSPCVAGPTQVIPPSARSDSLTGIVDFVCAQPVHALTIQDDLFDLAGPDYHTLAAITWPTGSDQFAFAPEARSYTVSIGAAGAQASGTRSFYLMGVEHILIGWDHLLFLACLLLLGGSFWGLLKIVTAFTIAHSITLAAAAFDVVTLPSRLIESAIALSIAYVAAENVFLRDRAASKRWVVAFVFGLVHGFGFSSVLKDLGLPKTGLVWSLLGFNLGVETGQAVAVAVAMPLLLWLRKMPWERRAITTASSVVLAVGLGLFIERAFF
ncbi:MAG: HupE/UreJ family protein [Betaproteobacteria bacterium]